MSTLRIFVFSFLIFFTAGSLKNEARAQSYANLSYQDFYDDLAPYGEWLYDDDYGYVWLPDVGPDFRPYYTNGYWAYTDYGNTWISYYNWGWAAFHYGRWTYDNYYGWLWIPGNEWAPAWVSWRSANDYYGWAPMGPGVTINVNLNLIPMDWWMFVSPNYMYDRSFYRYCNADWGFRRNIYRRTRIINYTYVDNRTTYYCGPRSDDYYRRTGMRPSMFRINNSNRPGNTRVAAGNVVNIYRPQVRPAPQARPAQPMRVERGISNRPQSFGGSMESAAGRMQILRQSPRYNNQDPNLRRPEQRINNGSERFGTEQPANQQRTRMNERMNPDPRPMNRNADNSRFSSEQQPNIAPSGNTGRDYRGNPGLDQQKRQQEMQQQRMQQQADQQRAFQQQQADQQRRQQDMQQRMQQQADQQRAFQQQQADQQRRQQEMQQRMQQQADQQRVFQQQQADQQRRQQEMQQRMQQQADQQRAFQQQQADQQRRQQEMQQQRMQQQAEQQRPREDLHQRMQPNNEPQRQFQPQQNQQESRPTDAPRGRGMNGFRR